MKTISRFALAAAAGLFVGAMAFTPAKAADLGGDCCADLEERVAELEATTARKGNRVVSLQIYGQVNHALMFWDDGVDDDVYVVDNDASGTRLGVRGSGSLKPGLTAGYRIEWDMQVADSSGVSQLDHLPAGDNSGTGNSSDLFDIRQANVYVESDQFGRVTLGQQSVATDGVSQVNLGGTFALPDATGFSSFIVRDTDDPFNDDDNVTWGTFFVDGDGGRNNVVRYDSPSLYGFILSASWGEDDLADVALRFSQEWNSFRVAAAVGYRQSEVDEKSLDDFGGDDTDSVETIAGSASVMHVPSGLFATVSLSETETDAFNGDTLDQDHWYVQAGVNRNWTGYGSTRIFADYGEYNYDAGQNDGAFGFEVGEEADVERAEASMYGVGIEQSFDSAAVDVYLHYRHYQLDDAEDLDAGDDIDSDQEDLDQVIGGMRIQF